MKYGAYANSWHFSHNPHENKLRNFNYGTPATNWFESCTRNARCQQFNRIYAICLHGTAITKLPLPIAFLHNSHGAAAPGEKKYGTGIPKTFVLRRCSHMPWTRHSIAQIDLRPELRMPSSYTCAAGWKISKIMHGHTHTLISRDCMAEIVAKWSSHHPQPPQPPKPPMTTGRREPKGVSHKRKCTAKITFSK